MLARQYLEEEQRQKEEKQRREIEDKEEMRRMLLEQMEKKATEEASNNLRVQKYEYRKSLFDLDCSVSFHVLNQVNESGQLLLCCSRNYPSPPPLPPTPLQQERDTWDWSEKYSVLVAFVYKKDLSL